MSIRIGIFGYGNLGRGVETAIRQNPDMTLAAVFTRRAPESLKINTSGVPVYRADDVLLHKDEIDVMILCGGSATDLPVQTPALARHFNVVDSFDTHARIPEHFAAVDAAANEGGRWQSFQLAGIPVCSHSIARIPARCFPTERIRRSGERA